MSNVERTTIRYAGYGSYVIGIAGTALYLGSPWGFLLLALAGAIPGGFLLRQDVERRALDRERERFGAQRMTTAAARPAAPAPEPLGAMPPPVPPAD